MNDPTPIRLDPLISVAEDAAAEPRARARAFRVALSFPRTEAVDEQLDQAFPSLVAAQSDDDELVRLLPDAASLSRPRVAETIESLLQSDRPDVAAAARRAAATLAGSAGPHEGVASHADPSGTSEGGVDPFTALVDQALESEQPDDAHALACVVQTRPLASDRLDALARRALEGDAGDEVTFWLAVAAARQGRVDALLGYVDGSREGPGFTWGQPERAYAYIAEVRPLPPTVLVDLLGHVGINDPLDPHEVARGNLILWALTGIADAFGTPVLAADTAEEEPGDDGQAPDMPGGPAVAVDHDPDSMKGIVVRILTKAEEKAETLGEGAEGPIVIQLGNEVVRSCLELPPCHDPDLARVIYARVGSSSVLDGGQLAALAHHLADVDLLIDTAAADVHDPDTEVFLKALGEQVSGRAPSPYRGSGGGTTGGDPDTARWLADLMTSGAAPPPPPAPPAPPAPLPESSASGPPAPREEEDAMEAGMWEDAGVEMVDHEADDAADAGDARLEESAAGGASRGGPFDDRGFGFIELDSDVEVPDFSDLGPGYDDVLEDSERVSLAPDRPGAPPAPAETSSPFTRTPHMDVSGEGPFHPGEHVDLRVYADREAARPDEAVATIRIEAPASQEEFRIDVTLVTSGHLQVIGASTRPLVLRRAEARSEAVHFTVAVRGADELSDARAQGAGAVAGIMAVFTYKTRPSGSVARSLPIAWPDETGTVADAGALVPPGAETVAAEADAAVAPTLSVETAALESDLQVTLVHVPGDPPGQFQCTVASPHVDLELEPETWHSGQGRAVVDEVLDRFIHAAPDRRSDELMGAGYEFFDAAPEAFKAYFWHLVDHVPEFETISIVTNEDSLPWELMVPTRSDPEPDDPTDPLGVDFDIGRWTSTTVKAAPQRIALGTGLVVAPRYDEDELKWSADEADLVSTLGTQVVTPATASALEEALRSGQGGLFHFVGHGHAEGAFHELSLEGERVAHTVLRHWLRTSGYLRHRPTLVVLNACEVGRPLPALLGSGGIPAVFIREGAAAVLAPTWSVKDSVAKDVAERFYKVLRVAPETPLPRILRDIRRLSYRRGDDVEDSYAAYCFYGDPRARVELPAGS
jgi:hypothetical protein